VICHFYRVPLGLAGDVAFFSIAIKQQEVGKEAMNCTTFPPKSNLL